MSDDRPDDAPVFSQSEIDVLSEARDVLLKANSWIGEELALEITRYTCERCEGPITRAELDDEDGDGLCETCKE